MFACVRRFAAGALDLPVQFGVQLAHGAVYRVVLDDAGAAGLHIGGAQGGGDAGVKLAVLFPAGHAHAAFQQILAALRGGVGQGEWG